MESAIQRNVRNYIVATGDSSQEALAASSAILETVKFLCFGIHVDPVHSAALQFAPVDVNDGNVQTSILVLVQALGEYLTSEEDSVRAKATGILSFVLANCQQNQINATAVNVLTDFFRERLADKISAPKLLEGLLALSKFDAFSNENATKTAKALFNVNVQSFQQAVRHTVFQTIDSLLKQHLQALQKLGDDFVFGFTQIMDGEKDPRNLLLAFGLIKNIIHEFDIASHVEDLFEVTFCYFPITFKPPPDDPYGITAEDLKFSLRECLAATPHFAKFAMPLLLEKLSSSSGSAKKDSMETIAACAPIYGATALIPYLADLFDALKIEIFHATDPALEDAALAAMHRIVATLSAGISVIAAADPTEKALKPLIVECMVNLKEPEAKNSKPAGRILKAAASASDPACNAIVTAAVPILLRQYRESNLATRKKAIIDVLHEFLEASKTLYGSIDDTNDGTRKRKRKRERMSLSASYDCRVAVCPAASDAVPSCSLTLPSSSFSPFIVPPADQDFVTPLLAYKDRFFEIFGTALMSSNEYSALRLGGLKGLHLMAMLRQYLAINEVGIVVQSINQILLDDDDAELRTEALKSLFMIAHHRPAPLLEHTVPSLVAQLPYSLDDPAVAHRTYEKTLHALGELAVKPALFAVIVPELLKKLDRVSNTDSTNTDVTYPQAMLSTVLTVLNVKSAQAHTDIGSCITTLVPRLVSKLVESAMADPEGSDSMWGDVSTLQITASIVAFVLRSLDASSQKTFIDQLFDLFMKGNTAGSSLGGHAVDAPLSQARLTLLFAAVVGSSRKEVILPVASLPEFLTELIGLALEANDDVQREAVTRTVGSVVNKWQDDAGLTTFVQTNVITKLSAIMTSPVVDDLAQRKQSAALLVHLWITKALVLRTHALGFEMTDSVIKLFGDPQVGKKASEGFNVIIGDDELVLNKASFAVIKLLYKQRFFNHCLPGLVSGFKSSMDDVKHNHLIALSYVLRNIPKQVLLNELPPLRFETQYFAWNHNLQIHSSNDISNHFIFHQLFPLLIQSLSLPYPSLKIATLNTFYMATTDAPQVVAAHIQTLIPALLGLSKMAEPNTMKVRIAALRCLAQYPSALRYDILHPYKTQVLLELGQALDDNKRLVRRHAVDCRARWYTITS
ncbi:Dos2-interacting transcription regulator of RNA-Pol-II-domain-containing protein [Jimgerdemannia flammicorona]|uniref:MMS19 nucleotide excision repair protein n=1 Tax=Jimgerdemannia flammicorona TaxID=994334 RepID=A0A433QUE7_9FUNG|nr:Dos2-interacting transcription regulator of RNA-Pol-II-domain-containing protein [Jimgerdemannia flammicorona]